MFRKSEVILQKSLAKVDPRMYGKSPFGGDESEEKEDENLFPVFSARSQHDMRVMVSALTQVIGNQQSSESMSPTDNHPSVYNPQDPDQQVAPTHQDQGIYVLNMSMLRLLWLKK